MVGGRRMLKGMHQKFFKNRERGREKEREKIVSHEKRKWDIIKSKIY